MIALNHALTGAVIGLVSGNPVVAVPAALVSHFICDALPHYGKQGASEDYIKSTGFKRYLAADALLCFLLVVLLVITQPAHWALAAVCAFLAALPDFAWLPGFLRVQQGAHFRKRPNVLMRFAASIQWFERPVGVVVEIVWLCAFSTIIATYIWV